MRNKKEFVGTLKGFDDFVSKNYRVLVPSFTFIDMVLTEVTELYEFFRNLFVLICGFSEENVDGTYTTSQIDQILLNGSGIVMVRKASRNVVIIIFSWFPMESNSHFILKSTV